MTQRTLHEASALLDQALPDVYECLKRHVSVSSATWDTLSECKAMYCELLETDEGNQSVKCHKSVFLLNTTEMMRRLPLVDVIL